MRIAYCLNSISYVGGIEKITSAKACALGDIPGNEVYIIVTDCPEGEAAASGRLSPKVRLVNLAVGYYTDDWKSKWNVLKGILVKRRLHKKRLKRALYEIRPDVVISVGQSEKYMLTEIKGDWVSVREMHFVKNFRNIKAVSGDIFRKISAHLSNFYEYHYKINRYDQIVTLTQDDKIANWKKSGKVSVIPNMLIHNCDCVASLDIKKVIAAGRLTDQKNFSSLIRAFRMVADRHPDWILEIYGDGNEHEMLQNLISQLQLERNVRLCGITTCLHHKMSEASCFVLSSIYEGFGLVIIEAMSCGLPVVSYDCPCGPKDIITDGVDGYLVPTSDEQMLAERICCLIENPDRRAEMGTEAVKKSGNYRVDKIIPMWMELFERLVTEKHGKC